MKRNPWIDRVLPANASAEVIRDFYRISFPVMPPEQQEYAKLVLLSLPALPDDVRGKLETP